SPFGCRRSPKHGDSRVRAAFACFSSPSLGLSRRRLPEILDHHQIGLSVVDLGPGDITTVPSDGKSARGTDDFFFNSPNLGDLPGSKIVELDWMRDARSGKQPS